MQILATDIWLCGRWSLFRNCLSFTHSVNIVSRTGIPYYKYLIATFDVPYLHICTCSKMPEYLSSWCLILPVCCQFHIGMNNTHRKGLVHFRITAEYQDISSNSAKTGSFKRRALADLPYWVLAPKITQAPTGAAANAVLCFFFYIYRRGFEPATNLFRRLIPIPATSSGRKWIGVRVPYLAKSLASQFPVIPLWPGTQTNWLSK